MPHGGKYIGAGRRNREEMEFRLRIDTGNEAMETPGDIGRALKKLGTKFCQGADGPEVRDCGKIMDDNGNSVGQWEVSRG